jgi:hypothetical protein
MGVCCQRGHETPWPILSSFCFPSDNVRPCHGPKVMGPITHGLNLQKCEPKQTFSLYKWILSGISLQ